MSRDQSAIIDEACENLMGHTNWMYMTPDHVEYRQGDLCVIFHRDKIEEEKID